MKFYTHDLVFGNKMGWIFFYFDSLTLRSALNWMRNVFVLYFMFFYAPRICIQWNKACFFVFYFFICCTRQCESEKKSSYKFYLQSECGLCSIYVEKYLNMVHIFLRTIHISHIHLSIDAITYFLMFILWACVGLMQFSKLTRFEFVWYIKLKEIPHHQINSNRALFCEIELGNKSSISSISSHFLSVSLIIKMYFNILLFFLLHFYTFIDFHSHLPSSRINIFINVSEHFFNFLFERCLRVKNGVQFVKYMMKEVLSS